MALNLRGIDALEAWELHKLSPTMAVNGSLYLSHKSYAVLVDGDPVCIFGVQPESMLGEVGIVWMLATDDIKKINKTFIRLSKPVFLDLTKEYETVYNYVHRDNKISLKWLEWLGFDIQPVIKAGNYAAGFHKVEYRRK